MNMVMMKVMEMEMFKLMDMFKLIDMFRLS